MMKTFLSSAAVIAAALALGACGSSGGGTAAASSDNARDTARLKLQQCLKQNGVDLPAPGQGQGQGGVRQLSDAQRTKMQKAMSGPCAKYRNAAFGNVTADQREEFQDAFTKFAACMRKQGVDIPSFTPGQGAPPAAGRINRNDPKVRKAMEACQSVLPRGGAGGGPGAGGPAPGGSAQ